jgi:dTDP-4-dehydrorhamnose reductase
MKSVYVTGAKGKIGSLLVQRGCSPLHGDVTDKFDMEAMIGSAMPSMIIHLASKSDVDWCENPANIEELRSTNLRGAFHVFDVAEQQGIRVIVISTDHVYDGRKGNYKESQIKELVPVNQYGLSKLGVEALASSFDNVKIIRTSTLFNPTRGLIRQYVQPLEHHQEVHVPTFLQRSFMYMNHFVDAVIEYAYRFEEMPKILNIAGGPHPISWYEFVLEMANVFDFPRQCVKKQKRDNPDYIGAPRPHKAGLDISMALQLGIHCPTYIEGLQDMKKDVGNIL